MNIQIKKMETEEETRGKAYVHWRAWHDAYPGLVSREYPRICLWVLKENKRAIRFYRKYGFCPDGEEMYSANIAATEIRMILKR